MDINQAKSQPKAAEPAAGFAGKPLLSLTGDKSSSEKEKLTILAKEFESIFMNQMLKTMRATISKSGLIDGGRGEEIFTEMLDEEMSRQMAFSQKDGLSASLVEQLMYVSQARNDAKPMDKNNDKNGDISPQDK